MEVQELLDAGSDILNAVTDAVGKNDYSDLSTKIQERVTEAVNNINIPVAPDKKPDEKAYAASERTRQSDQYWKDYQELWKKNNPQTGARTTKVVNGPYGSRGTANNPYMNNGNNKRANQGNVNNYFVQTAVSHYDGLAPFILGIAGTVIGGFGVLSSLGASLLSSVLGMGIAGGMVMTVIFAAITGVSIFGIIKGKGRYDLAKDYYMYGKALGGKEYFALKDAASVLRIPEKKLKEQLDRMIAAGYIPGARYDKTQSTLMLTEKAYKQYLDSEKSLALRQEEEKRRKEEQERMYDGLSEDVAAILKEGNKYIESIHEANEKIPDIEMSKKLYHLENIMQRIFDKVRQEPDRAPELRRLMNYYLPTTMKLLNAYIDLEAQPQVGDNIIKPKKEIEEALDVINDAFEKLLDGLFQSKAWDISSDISVMKTMMAQDGLVTDEKSNE